MMTQPFRWLTLILGTLLSTTSCSQSPTTTNESQTGQLGPPICLTAVERIASRRSPEARTALIDLHGAKLEGLREQRRAAGSSRDPMQLYVVGYQLLNVGGLGMVEAYREAIQAFNASLAVDP